MSGKLTEKTSAWRKGSSNTVTPNKQTAHTTVNNEGRWLHTKPNDELKTGIFFTVKAN